jgi:hypothetical protein
LKFWKICVSFGSQCMYTCGVGRHLPFFQKSVSKHPHCRIRKWMNLGFITSPIGSTAHPPWVGVGLSRKIPLYLCWDSNPGLPARSQWADSNFKSWITFFVFKLLISNLASALYRQWTYCTLNLVEIGLLVYPLLAKTLRGTDGRTDGQNKNNSSPLSLGN